MNRFLKWIPLVLLAALLMQGCSSLGIGKGKSKVTLTVVASFNQFNAYVPLLTERFPELSFNVIDVDKRLKEENTPVHERQRRVAEIIETEKPDLYYFFSPDHYTGESRLVDLASLLERDHVELNDIQQQVVASSYDSEGRLTSLSPTIERDVLYINRKLFQEYAIAEPALPMSWEQFRETAAVFKEKNPNISGYWMSNSWWSNYSIFVGENMMGLRWIEDGQLTLDRPKWKEISQQLVEDYRNQVSENDGHVLNYSERLRTGMFVERASYVHTLISNNANTDSWTIAELPKGMGNTRPTPYVLTAPLSLDKSSEHLDKAWELILYLMSEEGAELISSNTLASGFVTYPQYVNIGDYPTDVIYQSEGTAVPRSTDSLTNEAYSLFDSVLQKQFNSIISGTVSFDQAWGEIENMIREINADPTNFLTRKG